MATHRRRKAGIARGPLTRLRRKLAGKLVAEPLGELGLAGLREALADRRALPGEDRGHPNRLRADRRPVEAQQLFGVGLGEVLRVGGDQLILEQRGGEDAGERPADHVDQLPLLRGRDGSAQLALEDELVSAYAKHLT